VREIAESCQRFRGEFRVIKHYACFFVIPIVILNLWLFAEKCG
jgi:hypothetical protein